MTRWSTSSNSASAASRVSFWVIKFTETEVTPSSLARSSCSSRAQLAQSISSSLNAFFMVGSLPLWADSRVDVPRWVLLAVPRYSQTWERPTFSMV